MSRRNPSLPPEVEAEVAARLERALAGGLDDGLVDVARLATGTRAGIRRAAVRRRVAVAAATAATSAPASAPNRSRSGTRTPDPSTSVPAADAAVPPPEQGPPATVVPLTRVLGSDSGLDVAYRVPRTVNYTARDFPRPLLQLLEVGDYRFVSVVSGQGCGTYTPARAPVAANSWSWAEEDSNRSDQLTVTLTVTGWVPGTASGHFAEVVDNTGVCRWMEPPAPVSARRLVGDERWLATFGDASSGVVRAAVRVGDVIVSVEVHDPAGTASAVSLAAELTNLAAGRVQSSGLVRTAAQVS
ncbi:hypothetical protein [Kineosporia sp. A_224]|uniref:hypothetical protein n=1 Tax=Kineosporia sp. A_224 TaxID=1962180 RepID=UPI000B4BC8F1|nr:hypothetical protein [Kineosporia sp. A_224]